MTEKIFQFGPNNCLVGVLAQPATSTGYRPAIIVCNIGINHRVGPNRIWVELARQMAFFGFPALRFDLSGLGDSESCHDFGTELERAKMDLREAMDALQKQEIAGEFVVAGLCSGMESAYAVAKTDSRIRGAIFINGYSYLTPSWKIGHYVHQILSPSRWRQRFYSRFRKTIGSADEMQESNYFLNCPPIEEFRSDLRTMLERKTRLLFVYSGGNSLFLGKKQFEEMTEMSEQSNLSISYYPMADSLFFSVPDRAKLLQELGQWMQDGFIGSPPASPTS